MINADGTAVDQYFPGGRLNEPAGQFEKGRLAPPLGPKSPVIRSHSKFSVMPSKAA
jgi:hypothetical protein